MEPGITYCTAYPKDSSFGALHDTFTYRLTCSCTANPEYDPGDMRKAILHALASSTDTTTPFLVAMGLPAWEGITPWYSAAIRSHRNLETLIQILAGHMRFVPAHKQSDSDTTTLSPAKWLVELVLISNEEGRNNFVSFKRIHQILAPALRITCHMTTDQIRFFPNTRETRRRPHTTPAERPMRPFPVRPAAISPRTPPRGPPIPSRRPPNNSLAAIPRYALPHRPIHLVELCGGIATGLEAILKSGHAVASYTWADIDQDAHTATSHRLARLHARHPLLLLRKLQRVGTPASQ